VTGTGIYRESVRLGLEVPIRHPLVNADVAGQDSVEAVFYRGRVFWIWGDTPSIAHPLWNYHATGATSRLPADGGLDPARGVDLDYFVDRRGRVRALAKVPGEGATWLSGLVNLPDARGEETLLAFYGKHVEVAPPRERGLARYDPQTQRFVSARVLETPLPIGSALRVRGAQGDFVHYGDDVRIPAQAESLLDPSRWQAFTPFARPGSKAERDAQGFVRWAWRTNVPPADAASLREGGIAPDETLSDHVTDVASGARVASRPDSTASNAHRGRYVRIFTQLEGFPSRLGEVWYVEGDTPMGPWVFARKIVSHRNYGFYNPRQHPFFDQRGGRTLYFEGTYSAAFGKGAVPTPREDYNQVMHRLDLDDPRLFLPVPIYDLGAGGRPERFVDKRGLRPADGDPPIAFFAHDRPLPGSLAVWWSGAACGERRLVAGSAPATAPLFFALAAPLPAPRTQALPVLAPEGEPAHAAYAYASPLRVRLPVSAHLPELIADAGPDRCLREGRAGGGARLVLDAAGSSGPDGVPLRYEWSWPGGVASGSRAEARLPAGLNDVRLRVSTPDGVSAHDALVVEVAPAQVRAGSGSALAARSTLRTSSRLRPARPPGPTWRLPPTSSIASRP
jgi:hypothetical protein